jgi:hypothetical protein
MRCKAPVLVSQFVSGPVVMLVGGRLEAQRPGPRPARRTSDPAPDPLAA